MTPKSGLALTSLVVIALIAGAAIVSIAALGQQIHYDDADAAALARSGIVGNASGTAALNSYNSYNKAEAEVLDRDLYPFCFDVGDGNLPSSPGKHMLGRDNRIFKDFAGRAFAHGGLAAAKEGRASEASLVIRRPAVGIGDLGCGVGNYK